MNKNKKYNTNNGNLNKSIDSNCTYIICQVPPTARYPSIDIIITLIVTIIFIIYS